MLDVAKILSQLDDYQRDAVTAHFDSHVLVTAGPGAGKSRVLTSRYAYMLANGIDPFNIVAVTFTNKAANEMKVRIANLLGLSEDKVRRYAIATFHSLCARWLRKYASKIGYQPNFTVYNQYRAQQTLQQVIQDLSVRFTPNIYSTISLLKNHMVLPESLPLLAATGQLPQKVMDYWGDFPAELARIYKSYIETMHSMNVMDFDDLLYYTVLLFDELSPVDDLGIKYVLQDEMQDMNPTQYSILSCIADAGAHLYFVGDTDQCLLLGTLIATPSGGIPIEKLTDCDDIIVAAGCGTTAVAKPSRLSVRHYTGRVFELVTESGKRVIGTPEHCMFTQHASQACTVDGKQRSKLDLVMFGSSSKTHGAYPTELSFNTSNETYAVLASEHIPVSAKRATSSGNLYYNGHLATTDYKRAWHTAMSIASEVPDVILELRARLTDKKHLFTPMSHVRAGMLVPVFDGEKIIDEEVVVVNVMDYSGPVYDLNVPTYHNYIAGSVVVHNSIYGFRGACPALVESFVDDYQPIQKRLVYNYRSCSAIVDVSSSVIKPSYNNSNLSYIPARAVKQGGSVKWFNLADDELLIPATVSLVKSLISTVPPAQIAVLCRFNSPLARLWRALLAQHIPSRLYRGSQDLDTPLLDLLAVAVNPNDTQTLRHLLLNLAGIGKAAAARVIENLPPGGIRSVDDLVPMLDSCVDLFKQEKQRNSVRALSQAVAVLVGGLKPSSEPLHSLLSSVSSTLYTAVKDPEQYTDQDEILLTAASYCSSTLDDLTELVTLANLSGDHNKDTGDAVVLSTVHGSKGLEYSAIIILEYPNTFRREDPEDPYGEMRVFYVALTRAIEQAYVLTAYSLAQLENRSVPCFVRDMFRGTNMKPSPFPISRICTSNG